MTTSPAMRALREALEMADFKLAEAQANRNAFEILRNTLKQLVVRAEQYERESTPIQATLAKSEVRPVPEVEQ